MNKILFAGGGSSGHVNPNLALIDDLIKAGWEIYYIGSKAGIENSLIEKDKVKFFQIRTGKLRRYFDLKNFIDPFNVLIGIFQAILIIREIKPNVIFSTGGYVSLPTIIGAYINKVPSIVYEPDIEPGIVNKFSFKFANNICTTFSETSKGFPKKTFNYTGPAIRDDIFEGDYETGLKLCGFNKNKPIIIVLGGSLGSNKINEVVRSSLSILLRDYQIVHICGKKKLDTTLLDLSGYKQFEYVTNGLSHLFKIASLAISRAGANAIFELYFLKIPNILIPLSTKSSRGDQIVKARNFETYGFSKVILEKDFSTLKLIAEINDVNDNISYYIDNLVKKTVPSGKKQLIKLINNYVKVSTEMVIKDGSPSNIIKNKAYIP